MIYNYKTLIGYSEKLISCFIQIDELFPPSLLSRINKSNETFSLGDYINKLNQNGDIFLFILDQQIMGFVAFYSNDYVTNTAYIPLLFVLPEYTGRGIGNELLEKVKRQALLKKMKSIRVNTWEENVKAILLYERNGYKILNKHNSNVELIMYL